MTKQEQADMRREELARVIVTKQDARIKELTEAVRLLGDEVRIARHNTAQTKKFAGLGYTYTWCAIYDAEEAVNANPIAAAAVKSQGAKQ